MDTRPKGPSGLRRPSAPSAVSSPSHIRHEPGTDRCVLSAYGAGRGAARPLGGAALGLAAQAEAVRAQDDDRCQKGRRHD